MGWRLACAVAGVFLEAVAFDVQRWWWFIPAVIAGVLFVPLLHRYTELERKEKEREEANRSISALIFGQKWE